jgi:hypothetical protein
MKATVTPEAENAIADIADIATGSPASRCWPCFLP